MMLRADPESLIEPKVLGARAKEEAVVAPEPARVANGTTRSLRGLRRTQARRRAATVLAVDRLMILVRSGGDVTLSRPDSLDRDDDLALSLSRLQVADSFRDLAE